MGHVVMLYGCMGVWSMGVWGGYGVWAHPLHGGRYGDDLLNCIPQSLNVVPPIQYLQKSKQQQTPSQTTTQTTTKYNQPYNHRQNKQNYKQNTNNNTNNNAQQTGLTLRMSKLSSKEHLSQRRR